MLRKSPDIVIATPGRLIDHLKNTPSFSLDNVEVLILDEADRLVISLYAISNYFSTFIYFTSNIAMIKFFFFF